MHKWVEHKSCDAVERDEEVIEGVLGNPEATAVVAKQVVDERNVLGDRLTRCLGQSLQHSANMHIEPGVMPACETAGRRTLWHFVCKDTRAHDRVRLGEHDSIHIINMVSSCQ